jgi:UDP-N-acetylmuramate--alanine ligase
VPFYGFAVMCTDHPVVQTLVGRIEDRRLITYGENPQADARLVGLKPEGAGSRFTVAFRDRAAGRRTKSRTSRCRCRGGTMRSMPRRRSRSRTNSASRTSRSARAFAGFGGVKRRFTRTGDWNGVTVFDDYGHHPVEIAAVLKAARESTKGKVIAVMQPHRYTRLARCSISSAPVSTTPTR